MKATERVILTVVDGELRDRYEAWRADQYAKTGRIPTMVDAGRILLHLGLESAGFLPEQQDEQEPPTPTTPIEDR